jgi:hypothetical protein
MTAEEFDKALNDIYTAGYHDGAFPSEPSYSDQFNALREAMLKHDADRREKTLSPPLPPEVVAVLDAVEQANSGTLEIFATRDKWQAAGRPGLPPGKE